MSAELVRQLRFIQDGGNVRRFHTVPTIAIDTDARHSFGAAWLVWILTGGKARSRLLMGALAHDLAEQTVGDVPAPAKRALGIGIELNELEDRILLDAGFSFSLTPEEQRTLKIADNLDGMMFCVQERRMGNRHLDIVFDRYAEYTESMKPEGVEADLLRAVHTLMEEARA